MHLFLACCVFISAAGGADQHRAVHDEWLQLHKKSPSANAQLIFDPREHAAAMWIEQNGVAYRPKKVVADLPANFDWYAFHVTNDGIAQLSFPVRVMRPKLSRPGDRESEQIWIIGASEDQTIQFHLAPEKRGHAFGAGGTGSPIDTVDVQLPQQPPDARQPKQLQNSTLAPQSPKPLTYNEQIKTRHFTFSVKRVVNP